MEELMQKLSGYLDAAAGVISEYAPQAVDAALFVIRAEAIFSLTIGSLSAGLVVVLYRACVGQHKKATKVDWGDDNPHAIAALFFGTSAIVACIVAAVKLLCFYNWIAAFDPVLGLVYRAGHSAGLL